MTMRRSPAEYNCFGTSASTSADTSRILAKRRIALRRAALPLFHVFGRCFDVKRTLFPPFYHAKCGVDLIVSADSWGTTGTIINHNGLQLKLCGLRTAV